MTNKISYWVPKPSKTPTGKVSKKKPNKLALNFGLGAVPFKAQFDCLAVGNLNANTLEISLAALNAGYGATSEELLLGNPADWESLQAYLWARLLLMLSILDDTTAAPHVLIPPFVKLIEDTESSGLSYLLGSVMGRIATETWAGSFPGHVELKRFWHLKVAKDAAVCLDAKSRPGNSQEQNPDFIFETALGWFTLEAKGTFLKKRWPKLREGLLQARKLKRIAFYDVSTGVIQNVSIQGFTCSLSWLDGSRHLQVTHVDPVNHERTTSENTITVVPEFAELVQFQGAYMQFDLPPPAEQQLPAWTDLFSDISWISLKSALEPGRGIYLGMPRLIQEMRGTVDRALLALRIVVPLFARNRKKVGFLGDDALLLNQRFFSEIEQSVGEAREFWDSLRRDVAQLPQAIPREFWAGVLRQVATAPRLNLPRGGRISMLELSQELRRRAEVAATAVEITPRDSQVFVLRQTDNGLFVARGVGSS